MEERASSWLLKSPERHSTTGPGTERAKRCDQLFFLSIFRLRVMSLRLSKLVTV